ncbi:MAG: bis(5'-nucleosyl)-tetraphosphatase (symmetrical) YqeK [Oscillospiraceae bacterium]|jgi:predicted HD superfamily hydrolase involved in NAD metabolism|nr:bis(5'-nucleosyl)-tetraphosphatase (symmetrical) YqeK [Oscillospiraceae bacterium]
MMKESTEFYTCLIKNRLSGERFKHSIKTAEMCRELAEKHGYDPKKAYLAGILHDICKEESEKELKRLIFSEPLYQSPMKLGIGDSAVCGLDPLEKEIPKLWHAPAGAVYVREKLEVDDTELISAIRFHTVGRENMSKLEKILYLGDLVERSRDYPEVEKYREYALLDLNHGMYEALKWTINDCLQRKKQISLYTYEAYNYYLKKG